jgi:ribonuclease I
MRAPFTGVSRLGECCPGPTMLVGHGWQKNDACALKIQPVHV